jgi:hypothetical protein
MGARAERAAAGIVTNRNGAVTSAVLVHLRVEPAHFDWRWRERPALALLAWEALTRDPLVRLRRFQVESIGTKLILGQRLSPIATSQHRPCWAALDPLERGPALRQPATGNAHRRRYGAAGRPGTKRRSPTTTELHRSL